MSFESLKDDLKNPESAGNGLKSSRFGLYEFGDFRLDAAKRLLLRQGVVVPLTPKAFDVLLLLVSRQGHVVGKDELLSRVWPDTVVEENNLNVNVSVLRKTLGETPSDHHFIVTVPGCGYQFVAEVRLVDAENGGARKSEVWKPSVPRLSGAHSMSSAEYLLNGIKRHRGSVVFASMAVLLLIASLVYFFNIFSGRSGPIDSMAVLHFVNEGGDPAAEYLASGFSDSLINSLSQIPKLRVKALNAVSRYKGQNVDATTVGRELNVQAVLFIRMSQQVDALEISTELVSVSDNSRLWGAQYKRTPSDLLGLQKEIVGEIAEKLSLDGAEKQPPTKQYTTSKEAYDAYLRGHVLLEKRTPQATEKSIEYLEQAIRIDPNYALADAELGFAYISYRSLDPGRRYTEVFPKAKEAVAKALEIDDSLAEAHTVQGQLKTFDWDWAAAERSFRRGIELNRNSAFAHSGYAYYLIAMKRFDEAVAESKRAVELEPTSVFYNRTVAVNLFFARRYDEAIEQSLKTLELDPIMPTAYAWLAKAYQQKGLYDQAIEAYIKDGPYVSLGPDAAAELRDAYAASGWKGFWRKALDFKVNQAKKGGVYWYGLAEINAQLGDKDQVFAALEKSYEEHEHNVRFVVADPLWDDLRSDPRYLNLVRRIGLEP